MEQVFRFRDLVDLPGSFTFKIIVKPAEVSAEALLDLTRDLLSRELGDPELSVTNSRHGKYRSYTLRIHLTHHTEIEALYEGYRGRQGIVWVL